MCLGVLGERPERVRRIDPTEYSHAEVLVEVVGARMQADVEVVSDPFDIAGIEQGEKFKADRNVGMAVASRYNRRMVTVCGGCNHTADVFIEGKERSSDGRLTLSGGRQYSVD